MTALDTTTSEPDETIVPTPDTHIAVRDHGGDGPPLLLIHGAGGNLLHWAGFAPLLRPTHRVVTMDLRGHGRSGDAPWTWHGALDDIGAVVEHLGLGAPALVGHSLGGMLAGAWARRHPGCPAVVSLDGHRSVDTDPANYSGLPDDRLRDDLARLRELFTAQARVMAQPMDEARTAALLEAQRGFAASAGLDPDMWTAAVLRGLTEHNGFRHQRPGPDTTAALSGSAEFRDSLPVFTEVTAPLLVVVAEQRTTGVPEELHGLMSAFLAGLLRDLGALSSTNPRLRVRRVAAGHGLVHERPREVADLVVGFLREHGT